MELQTLKLRPDFVGQLYYEKLGQAPTTVDGKRGNFARHIVTSEKHGVLHVITPATAEVFPYDCVVEVINPRFYEDYALYGRNVAPALNVYGDGLKVIKGGQN